MLGVVIGKVVSNDTCDAHFVDLPAEVQVEVFATESDLTGRVRCDSFRGVNQ